MLRDYPFFTLTFPLRPRVLSAVHWRYELRDAKPQHIALSNGICKRYWVYFGLRQCFVEWKPIAQRGE
jgi:hypothetical protein